jgi:hypothetical protein
MDAFCRINECDYNVSLIQSLTFDEFKNEGLHSFCVGKKDKELRKIYNDILALNGNATGPEKESAKSEGEGTQPGQ